MKWSWRILNHPSKEILKKLILWNSSSQAHPFEQVTKEWAGLQIPDTNSGREWAGRYVTALSFSLQIGDSRCGFRGKRQTLWTDSETEERTQNPNPDNQTITCLNNLTHSILVFISYQQWSSKLHTNELLHIIQISWDPLVQSQRWWLTGTQTDCSF